MQAKFDETLRNVRLRELYLNDRYSVISPEIRYIIYILYTFKSPNFFLGQTVQGRARSSRLSRLCDVMYVCTPLYTLWLQLPGSEVR